jgi:hypothetical protein
MPNGSGAWTEARFDAFEAGMGTDDANKDIKCYGMYIMLCYEPAAAVTDAALPSGFVLFQDPGMV